MGGSSASVSFAVIVKIVSRSGVAGRSGRVAGAQLRGGTEGERDGGSEAHEIHLPGGDVITEIFS
jgi:hypothetical protein